MNLYAFTGLAVAIPCFVLAGISMAFGRQPVHRVLAGFNLACAWRRLADLMCDAHPELKVLFISGYPDDLLGEKGILEPGISLLRKPLTRSMIAEGVRQVLDTE